MHIIIQHDFTPLTIVTVYCQDRKVQDIRLQIGSGGSKNVTILHRSMAPTGEAAVERKDISTILMETYNAVAGTALTGSTAVVVYSMSEVAAVHSNLIRHVNMFYMIILILR